MVLWEAQFGDFANGAQVVMDQFIASGEMKWLRMSGLTLLLPHGYEGQGPEHSAHAWSAICSFAPRTICRSAYPPPRPTISTSCAANASQLPQAADRADPKSLLRNKKCTSFLSDMTPGTSFHRVLRDQANACPAPPLSSWCRHEIKRVVLCSGKVYFDLMEEREKRGENRIQILRIEQLYPFPENVLAQELNRFPKAELVWCQEEPQNQGAWNFVRPRIEATVPKLGGNATRAMPAARICLHRRRPDEAASGRTGRLPEPSPFPLRARVTHDRRNQSARMGESVTEATISKWFKKEGDAVKRDEPLLELETDKVTVEVPSPADGAIESISAQAGATVQVGALLGAIAEGAAGSAPLPSLRCTESRSSQARGPCPGGA
jgi:biotin carboxyl carrier protein